MRPPLKVLITVDTEVWPRKDSRLRFSEQELQPHVHRDIYGKTSDGEYGLRYQIDKLNADGLKAVFFVESLFASAVGTGPLSDIVKVVQSSGHEVGLHVHTEWLDKLDLELVQGRSGQSIKDFSLRDQVAILSLGLENLKKAGAHDVVAFRAGNYGANFDTLRALAKIGLEFDSSYNPCYLKTDCGLPLKTVLTQPAMIEQVCEVPISTLIDFPGHKRHCQLVACSYTEIEQALVKAWQQNWGTFVIVSHSFEMLARDGEGIPNRPDLIVIERFEKLCRFLSSNKNKFETCGFADLDRTSIVGVENKPEIRSNIGLTAMRLGQQILRRIK